MDNNYGQYNQQPGQYNQQPGYQPPPVNGPNPNAPGPALAVVSMVIGLFTTIFSWINCAVPISTGVWLSIIMVLASIVAIVLGIVSLAKGSRGKGMAIVGIIFGVIGMIACVIVMFALIGANAALSEYGAIGNYAKSYSFFDYASLVG